jgi:tetratricopeptide (TPR) repeat protein
MKKSAAYFGLFSFGNRIRLREWNWKMESGANTKEVLTPKNVYRFLTDNLPGLYPHGVIPAAERKGLTLVKFWAQVLDGIIPPEWHASLFGGTQRSRRLSDMMNRTGVQPLPPKLQQEMNALLSGETLIRLSQQVQDFLRSAHYDADALTRALPDFVRMMMENEECMKPEHEQVFENLQKSRETLPRTFVDMLTLSWLVLLAFYGPEMGSRELLDFCQAQEHSAQALYLLSSHVTFGRRVPLSMTGRNCELCRQGLSKDEYVMDAASCLPQLTDAIRQGGKIAVTGMGGIGKTEMTRQALALLAKEELFSRMAWVQYENSLASSLRMAFDGLDGVAEENVLSTVREKLEAPYQGRTLLLIDSVDMPPEADEGLREIEHWGCDVLVTTRFPLGAGFRNIAVPLLSEEASRALFVQHDPYLKGMGSEETEALHQVLSRVAGHPLAIILLAHLAKMKRWTMAQLLEELDRISPEGLRLAGGKFSAIAQRIAQMVSTDALSDRERQVLAVFATFPAWTIPVRDALTLLRDFGTEDELLSALETAADYGLLTSNWRGYAMHPVLAESFRPLLPPMEKVPRLAEIFRERATQSGSLENCKGTTMALALHAVSDFFDAPVELMSGISIGVVELLDTSREEIPAARLAIWRQYKQKESQQTAQGRFLDAEMKLVLDAIQGGELQADAEQIIAQLPGASDKNAMDFLTINTILVQRVNRELCVRIIEQADQLIQPDSLQYAVYRAESVCAKQLVGVSVPDEEVNQAISYFKEQMKNPKKLHDAAGRLGALLSTTMLSGWWGKIKPFADELAQIVDEKHIRNTESDHALGMIYRHLQEFDKALMYEKYVVDAIQPETLQYYQVMANYLVIKQESGRCLENKEILEEELPKIAEKFGKNNGLYAIWAHSYSKVQMELRRPEEAMRLLDEIYPIVMAHMGEWNAKVLQIAYISCLAMTNRDDEARAKAMELRAYFVKAAGEESPQVHAIDQTVQKVNEGFFHKENKSKQV